MNKAASVQLEHFNQSNALAWALTMGLFPLPVIFSERTWDQITAEAYYLQLGKEDRFGWNEPEGHVFQLAAENLKRLQGELYRVCYQLSQASSPTGVPQSGLSKLRDFTVTQEVLRVFGDLVKDHMKRLLRAVGDARQDEATFAVAGLDDFDINDFGADLADATNLLALGIESPTLRKLIHRRLASKYLCDQRQEVKDRIFREIEEASDRRER
jgi:hypothetical protein